MDKEKIKQLCKSYEDGTIKVGDFTDALEKEGVSCWVGFIIYDLHRKVRFLENVGKLSPEDQVTAYRWEREREERKQVYDKLETLKKKDNPEEWEDLMDKVRGPIHCEHGRSWASTCIACDKIHETLFPDMVASEEDEDDDE